MLERSSLPLKTGRVISLPSLTIRGHLSRTPRLKILISDFEQGTVRNYPFVKAGCGKTARPVCDLVASVWQMALLRLDNRDDRLNTIFVAYF
jgi:hypothetical protein